MLLSSFISDLEVFMFHLLHCCNISTSNTSPGSLTSATSAAAMAMIHIQRRTLNSFSTLFPCCQGTGVLLDSKLSRRLSCSLGGLRVCGGSVAPLLGGGGVDSSFFILASGWRILSIISFPSPSPDPGRRNLLFLSPMSLLRQNLII